MILVRNLCIRPLVLDDRLQHLVGVRDNLRQAACRSRRVEEHGQVIGTNSGFGGEDELGRLAIGRRVGDEFGEFVVLGRREVRNLHIGRDDFLDVTAIHNNRFSAAFLEQGEDDVDIAEVASEELRSIAQGGYRDGVDLVGELPTSKPASSMSACSVVE